MKNIKLILLGLFLSINLNAQKITDSLIWVKQFSDIGLSNLLIETDDSDNIFVAGTYRGCTECFISFDSEKLVHQGNDSEEVFLAKLAPNGKLISSHLLGGVGNDVIAGFEIDHAGKVLVYLEAEEAFLVENVLLEKGYNLIKFDNEINLEWSLPINGNRHNTHDSELGSLSEQLAITPDNKIVLAGSIPIVYDYNIILDTIYAGPDTFYSHPSFYDPLEIGTASFSVDTHNIFIAQIDTEGQLDWVKTYEHTSRITISNIAISKNKDVNLLGYFSSGEWEVEGKVLKAEGPNQSNSSNNAFLLKLDKDGEAVWVNKYYYNFRPLSLAIDAESNLVSLGYFYEKAYSSQDTIYSNGVTDLGLFKVDPNGNLLWGANAGDQSSNNHGYILANNKNELFISGLLSSLGGEIMNKFSPSGKLTWELNPIGSGNRAGQEVAFDHSGNLIQSAIYSGKFKIGNYSITPKDGALGWQNVILKYENQNPAITSSVSSLEDNIVQFQLFPVPAFDHLNILYELQERKDISILITDINGVVQSTRNIPSTKEGQISLNLKNLASGIYNIRMRSDDFTVSKNISIVQ